MTDLQFQNYYPSVSEYTRLLEAQGFRIEYARHFDRPTPLNGPEGLRNWVQMFRNNILQNLSPLQREQFLQRVEDIARPQLFHDGKWWADYVRLRVVAVKT